MLVLPGWITEFGGVISEMRMVFQGQIQGLSLLWIGLMVVWIMRNRFWNNIVINLDLFSAILNFKSISYLKTHQFIDGWLDCFQGTMLEVTQERRRLFDLLISISFVMYDEEWNGWAIFLSFLLFWRTTMLFVKMTVIMYIRIAMCRTPALTILKGFSPVVSTLSGNCRTIQSSQFPLWFRDPHRCLFPSAPELLN